MVHYVGGEYQAQHLVSCSASTRMIMRKPLPIILFVVGLAIVGYGLVQKEEKQASIELGDAEIQLGKKDSFFSPYFIIGGIAAIAGLVMLVGGRKS